MTKRILTIDGGGLRGVFSAAIVEQMEKVHDGKVAADIFDCFVGTSAGALLAAGLASGKSAGELKNVYIKFGEQLSKLMSAGGTRRADGASSSAAEARARKARELATAALEALLKDVFGEHTRAHDLKKRFAVASRDMELGKVVFFGNFPGDQIDESSFWSASGAAEDDPPVWEMVLRSAALPPLFSPAGAYLDGGVSPFANPTYAACIGVQRCLGWVPSTEILQFFSVGTGYHQASRPMTNSQGGPIGDVAMFSSMVGAMMQDINFLQHQIMKRRRSQRVSYRRYNLSFSEDGFARAGIPLEMAQKNGKTIFDVLANTATPEVKMLADIGTLLGEKTVFAKDFMPQESLDTAEPYVPFAADHPQLLLGLHDYAPEPAAPGNTDR